MSQTLTWIKHKQTFSYPSPRVAHAMCFYKTSLFIFGGRCGTNRNNQLYRFDTISKRWTEIVPKNIYMRPSIRSGHTLSCFGDSLYVYGGTSDADILYEYSIPNNEWRIVYLKNGNPPKMCGHSADIYGTNMILFGVNDLQTTNELFKINLIEKKWEKMNVTGSLPSPRFKHSSIIYNDFLYIFGGGDNASTNGNTKFLDDFYMLNLIRLIWTKLEIPNGPTKRNYHTAVYYDDRMFIFGGFADGNDLGDLMEFDMITRKWTRLDPGGDKPNNRSYHCSAMIGNSMWVFGGDNGTVLNELYELKIPKKAKISIIPRLEKQQFVDIKFNFKFS